MEGGRTREELREAGGMESGGSEAVGGPDCGSVSISRALPL